MRKQNYFTTSISMADASAIYFTTLLALTGVGRVGDYDFSPCGEKDWNTESSKYYGRTDIPEFAASRGEYRRELPGGYVEMISAFHGHYRVQDDCTRTLVDKDGETVVSIRESYQRTTLEGYADAVKSIFANEVV